MHVEAHHPGRTHPAPGVRALDGAAIAIEPGEVFGLLGPDAAGKCTASRALTTLARPDAGTASVAGHHVLRQPQR
jgi:ABC-2 type transport system ATP-binding protein